MTIQEWLGKDNTLGIDIWTKKDQSNSETYEEWLDRVSGNNESVKQLIRLKKFLFGGRILANRGIKRDRKCTTSNCYVMPKPEDNLESIFDCAKNLARTYSYGGGCGVDISKLSPRGAKVNNAAVSTSGAVSFMDVYSMVTEKICQEGRRGALMISLDCHHPDLEEFIAVKSDLTKVTKANISVMITDDFMEAVKNNTDFELSFTRESTGEVIKKTINARKIFTRIAEMNYDFAEPGCLFWSTVENYNLMSNTKEFEYAGVNPCAEEPLPAGGACLLGSINLSEFVEHPFSGKAVFNYKDFQNTVDIAIKALNDVLDEGLHLHPLKIQQETVAKWRQTGLGLFGLADMLIKMGIRYGSQESIDICDKIGFLMADTAIFTSSCLAKENGAFNGCNPKEIVETEYFKNNTTEKTKQSVLKYGLRNSQLLTSAPTGTISTMIGISGGIEPIYANYYERKTESLHGKDVSYKVYTKIVKEYMEQFGITDEKNLPDYFVTAQTLDYKERINMQSIWQKHIDASISSTVNVQNSFTKKEVFDLYMYAWEKKLKGVTIFRDGCKRTGILSTEDKKEEPEKQKFDYIEPISKDTIGETYGTNVKKRIACGKLYLNICRDKDGNLAEIFVNTGKGGICQSNINAISRLVSVSLRSGVKVEEIAEQLRGIICPACTKVMTKGEKLSGASCPDVIARTLLEEYNKEEIIIRKPKRSRAKSKEVLPIEEFDASMICPDCGAKLHMDGGCNICVGDETHIGCGYSKCG